MAQPALRAAEEAFGAIGFGQRPALIVIDFVNGFFYRNRYPAITAAARRTRPLVVAARAAGLPVVFTRIVYAEDGSDCGIWCLKSPRLKALTETAEAGQIIASLAPEAGEKLVRKTQASAFFATDLAGHLIGRGVDTLIFTGCTTSGCVRASVVDACSHNFRPIVVADCVADRNEAPHVANLHDIGRKYADIVESEALIARLRRSAAGG